MDNLNVSNINWTTFCVLKNENALWRKLDNFHIDRRNYAGIICFLVGIDFRVFPPKQKKIYNPYPSVKNIKLIKIALQKGTVRTAATQYRNLVSKWNKMARKKLGLELTWINPVAMFSYTCEVVSKTKNFPLPGGKRIAQTETFLLGSRGIPGVVPGVDQRQCNWQAH